LFFSFQVEETFERALGGVAEENVLLEINSLRCAMFFSGLPQVFCYLNGLYLVCTGVHVDVMFALLSNFCALLAFWLSF
jgi:hypothetical protein